MAELYPTVFVLYSLDTQSGDPSQALSSADVYATAEAAKKWLEVERRDSKLQDGDLEEEVECTDDLVWVPNLPEQPVGEYAYDEETKVQYHLVRQQVS
jgi:hypothetical protein